MSSILTGRFAPFLNVHLAALRAALAEGGVTVVVTGAEASRQSRFPWTAAEREAMIRAAVGEDAARLVFRHADDNPYLGQRPECPTREDEEAVCAAFFAGNDATVSAAVPSEVFAAMQAFRSVPDYARLAEEAAYIADYRRSWEAAPWPPTFVTADIFITCAEHLLLVRRGGQPGKGMWALPGGFVDQQEWVIDAAMRELREETGLDLDDATIRDCLRHQTVFDDPWRSARGRTVTHGFRFDLPGDIPEVAGGDDAQEARWWPIDGLGQLHGQFLEDHGQMIDYFLKAGKD